MGTSIVLSFAPRAVAVVAAESERVWVTSGGETIAFSLDGEIVKQFRRLALESAFEWDGRWFGVAHSIYGSTRDIHELEHGKRLFEADGDVIGPLSATRVLARTRASSTSRCTIHALPSGERVGRFETTYLSAFAANEDTLFVAERGADSIRAYAIEDASLRDELPIAPHRLSAGPRLRIGPRGELLVWTRTSLLWLDPASRKVLGEHELAASEHITRLQTFDDGVLVWNDGSLHFARLGEALAPLIEAGAGDFLFNDGRGWICAGFRSRPKPIFTEDASVKPKTLELDGWTPCGALAGHAVLKDSFAQLAFVPLDAPPGEQKARVISPLPVEPRTLLEAQVIDNPHNLLRLRTASHPLLELRTGPLGLGPDSIVRVGSTGLWEDRGQPLIDVLDIEEGGIVSRRLRADDTFVKVPPSLSLGTVTPYEPPPVPTVAVIPTPVRVALATLRSIGLIADTAPPPAEIESHFGRPDRPFSPVFLDEALSLFGPGPDVHLLHYDWDEFHLIPREVQEIVPNLAFEDSFDDGKDWLADDYFFKSPTGRGVHLDPDDLPIELISALNEALAHAGADRVVIPLLSETRALTIAVAPPRMLEAIEEHNLPGLLREA